MQSVKCGLKVLTMMIPAVDGAHKVSEIYADDNDMKMLNIMLSIKGHIPISSKKGIM